MIETEHEQTAAAEPDPEEPEVPEPAEGHDPEDADAPSDAGTSDDARKEQDSGVGATELPPEIH
jgi:hypothetical protein